MADIIQGSLFSLDNLASPQTITIGTGSNRILVVTLLLESTVSRLATLKLGTVNLTSAFYGTDTAGTPSERVEVWYLLEADIVTAASTSLNWTWTSTTPTVTHEFAYITLQDCVQTSPVIVTDSHAQASATTWDCGAQSPAEGSVLFLAFQGNNTSASSFAPSENCMKEDVQWNAGYPTSNFSFYGKEYTSKWLRAFEWAHSNNTSHLSIRKAQTAGESVIASGSPTRHTAGTAESQPGILAYVEFGAGTVKSRPLFETPIVARYEEILYVRGSGFGSGGTLTINSVSQTTTYWDDNLIVVPYVSRGDSAYGTGYTLTVTRTADSVAGSTTSCSLLPPTDCDYRTVSTPFAGSGTRVTCLASLANGNQLAWRKVVAAHYASRNTISVAADTTITVGVSGTITASTSDAVTHSFASLYMGQQVRFTTTTTLPAPLVAGTQYYASPLTATTCYLGTTLNNAIRAQSGSGTAFILNITSTGTGTHTMYADNVVGVYFERHNGTSWVESGFEAIGSITDAAAILQCVRVSDTVMRCYGKGFNANLTHVRLRQVGLETTVYQDFTPTVINDGVAEITLSLSTVPWPVESTDYPGTGSGEGSYFLDTKDVSIEAVAKNGGTLYTSQTTILDSLAMAPPTNNKVAHIYVSPTDTGAGSLFDSVSGATPQAGDQFEFVAWVTSEDPRQQWQEPEFSAGSSGYVGLEDGVTAQWRWWSSSDKSWTGWSDVTFDGTMPMVVTYASLSMSALRRRRR